MKVNQIASPVSHVILPGTARRVIDLEKHEALIQKEEAAELAALRESIVALKTPKATKPTILPGTISRTVNGESQAAKERMEAAADKSFVGRVRKAVKNYYPLSQNPISAGTLHSSFTPPTGRVSVTEQVVRETYALAQRARGEGRIPPKAGQGRFLDAVV